MTNSTSLLSQIKSLEEQLRVLHAKVQPGMASKSESDYTLAELEGLLQGKVDSAQADIDAILYQVLPEMDAQA